MFAAKISSSGECSWWWGVRLRPVVNEVFVGEAIEPVARSNSGLFYKVGNTRPAQNPIFHTPWWLSQIIIAYYLTFYFFYIMIMIITFLSCSPSYSQGKTNKKIDPPRIVCKKVLFHIVSNEAQSGVHALDVSRTIWLTFLCVFLFFFLYREVLLLYLVTPWFNDARSR